MQCKNYAQAKNLLCRGSLVAILNQVKLSLKVWKISRFLSWPWRLQKIHDSFFGGEISVLNLSGREVEKVVGVVGRHEEGVAARNLCRQNEKRKEKNYHKDKKVSNQKLCRVQDHGHLALHHHEHLRWEDNVQKGNNLMPSVGGNKKGSLA